MYIYGWGTSNPLSCRVESSSTPKYCDGAGSCRSTAVECAWQDIENGQSGTAVCGSSACKKACPNEGAATSYDTVAEVCYTSGQQSCSAGYECDATGTCTLASDVVVTSTASQTTPLYTKTADQYVGGMFVISDYTGSRNVTGITITENGTVDAANDLGNIKLYYETSTDCSGESYGGGESQYGSTDTDGFSGADGDSSFSGSVGISTSSEMCVYVVLDIGSGASTGETLEIEIGDASSDVTVSSGTVGPPSTVALSGTSTLQEPAQMDQIHYRWRNDDGKELGWYDPDWGYREKITINASEVPNTDRSYFPVMINTTDLDWRDTSNSGHVGQSDGGDILFTSADGVTKLDHEIESYDNTSGALVAWVEVPSVSASSNTDIYIYYGNASVEDQWNITGTWDDGGNDYFEMVQHLQETSGIHEDSSSGNNDGTAATGASGNYINVQHDEVAFATGDTYKDVDLSTAVEDQANAFIIVSHRGDDALSAQDMEQIYVTAKFIDDDTIRIERGETGTIANVAWQVVEADPDAPTPAFTVETGEVSFGSTDTSKTDTISDIGSTSNAIVLTQSRNANGDNRTRMLFRGKLNSSTQVQLDRAVSGATAEVRYWVIKFSSDITVYKGSTAMNAVASTSASIGGTVTLAQTAVFMTWDCNTNGLAQTSPRAWLSSTTQISFDRTAATGNCNLEWSVVEFPADASVQSDNNSSSPATSAELLNETISTVNQAHTFMYATNKCTGTGTAFPRPVTSWHISSDTNIEFRTSYNGQTNTWTYYAIDTSGWTFDTVLVDQDYAGQIDGGDDFSGSGSYVAVTDNSSLASLTQGTISFWANWDSINSAEEDLLAYSDKDDASSDLTIFTGGTAGTNIGVQVINDGSPSLALTGNSTISNSTWYLITLVADSLGNKLFVNNTEQTETYSTGSSATQKFFNDVTALDTFHLGDRQDSGGSENAFNGQLDEVRISNVARSDDWIITAYSNQSNPSSFYTVDTEVSYSPMPGATFAETEDTKLEDVETETTVRLRMEISNEGGESTGAVDYQLEVSGPNPSSCSAASYTNVDSNAQWDMTGTTYYADGDPTYNVTGGLTDENTSFVAGVLKESADSTGDITLATTEFTELEFSLQATSLATDGADYCFRLTNAGSTTNMVYTIYAEISLITSGSLSVDIVDSGGGSVGSPSVGMSAISMTVALQTSTGTFGTSSERIRVTNTTGTAAWTLSVAASATTAVWDSSGTDYDFNDPTAGAGDGGDADSVGGQLTLNPNAGTITPEGGCTTTGLTKGSQASFSEGITDSITLIAAGGSADTNCYWDFTGIGLSQTIPPAQPAASDYDINMVLSVVAS